jgi:lysophospholipase L1-like esterase
LWRIHVDAVKDILDHLIAGKCYCVHSLAAGGDWLIQMLRAEDYVEPLSQIEPDVFLFSGGGNDLLGDGRVANMTLHKRRVEPLSDRHRQLFAARVAATAKRTTVFDRSRYEAGVGFLAKEFIGFLNLILLQYFIFFSNLAHSKLASMVIVTHGYDFAVPTRRSTARLVSIRRLVNRLMGSGKWLWLPLEQKRLNDDEKRAVVYAMITEFNELLVSLAESKHFPYVYHVDNRGIARSDQDWYDEIHLTSEAYRRSASLFDVCISTALAEPGGGKKVFTVADLRDTVAAVARA